MHSQDEPISREVRAESDNSAPVDATSPLGVTTDQSPAELEAAIVEAGHLLHSSRHRLIKALAAFDVAGQWALDGAHTCAHWAASTLGVAVSTAREWLRVGKALLTLPEVDSAMGEGRLSYCAVRTLTRVAVDHPEFAGELVDLAESSLPGQLAKDLARWALVHDDEDQHDRRQKRNTWLATRTDPDGMGVMTVRLPAAEMGKVSAAVDARAMQSRKVDPGWRHPSLGYQRAIALLGLLSDGDGSRVETEVVVHVRGDGVSLSDGSPIAESRLAELVDGAFIRALVHNAEGHPVNASNRRRHPTKRQRRLADEKHPVCVDCGSDQLLQYDHEPPFWQTKRTHTDELPRRCPACHDRRHHEEGDSQPPGADAA